VAGGFTSKWEDKSGLSLWSLAADVNPPNLPSTKLDTNPDLYDEFESAAGSSVTPPQDRLKRNENLSKSGTIVISDSPISSPLKYEQIDYSSPVKMFSPIKKLEGSSNIYINDDSPSSSNSQTKRSKISVKDNRVVKQLFEGQKQCFSTVVLKLLLGTNSSFKTTVEKPLINYFDNLPDELLEIIFAQLPMLDLCLNSNRICCRWNQIISSERVCLHVI
jgi:hypothetical protein